MPLQILHEDDSLLFLNKPPGIVVQRGFNAEEPVLFDLAKEHTEPLFLLQRLDRGTSGVIFFSKRSDVNVKLTRQFERRRIRKRYLALCEGELAERQVIHAPLARTGAITFGVRSGGRRAVTAVAPVSASRKGSLVSVELRTGRTHQIRVHLAAIGHPLTGDWLYGRRNAARPMLHAVEVQMTHPLTNEPLCVQAPLPEDFLDECARRGIVHAGGQSDTEWLQLNH